MVSNSLLSQDERFMRRALSLAQQAEAQAEVPVGAVIVRHGKILGEGFNQPISGVDPSAHAEIVALRSAADALGNYRLVDSVMYVTIEPCMMCAGALVHARIGRLVFGAREYKAGAVHTHALINQPWQNHRIAVDGGVLESECAELMSNFFKRRRTLSGVTNSGKTKTVGEH